MVIIGNVSGTPIVANLEVGKPTVGSSHAVIWQEAIAANTIFRLATHIVMPAGDECWAFLTGAGTGRYNLYGFEYDGVAPDFP